MSWKRATRWQREVNFAICQLRHDIHESPDLAGVEQTEKSIADVRSPSLYILIVLSSIFGAFVYKLRFEGIFTCPADGYANGSYLADCQVATVGIRSEEHT